MDLLVEMRDVVPVAEGVLAGTHAPHGPHAGTGTGTGTRARARGGGGGGTGTARALLVRGPPLLALRAPAARPEEARRRPLERAAALAEARGGPAACRARGRVRGALAHGVGEAGGGGRGRQAHVLAVVLGALRRRREDRVGLAYPHEPLRGRAAAGRLVDVGVVRLGEIVEGSGGRWLGGLFLVHGRKNRKRRSG